MGFLAVFLAHVGAVVVLYASDYRHLSSDVALFAALPALTFGVYLLVLHQGGLSPSQVRYVAVALFLTVIGQWLGMVIALNVFGS